MSRAASKCPKLATMQKSYELRCLRDETLSSSLLRLLENSWKKEVADILMLESDTFVSLFVFVDTFIEG